MNSLAQELEYEDEFEEINLDFELTERQEFTFDSPANEILYGGAAGGGKSHLMRVASIIWCSQVPGLQVYLFRRKSNDLRKNHLEGPTGYRALLKSWEEEGFVKINESNGEIHFITTDAKIFLCHCQHEKDKYNYQGAEIHVLLMDELTTFTDTIYRFLRGRVRLGGLQVPDGWAGQFPKILCGSNPGNIGHTWVKDSFVTIAEEGNIVQMSEEEGGMKRQFVRAVLEDNPFLAKNDPDYEKRLEGLGNPTLVKAMRQGDWDIVAGGMIDDVWNKNIHILDAFRIPKTWKIDRSFDWGSSKPFSVGWWAESDGSEVELIDGTTRNFPRGTLFRIAEWYGWNGKANQGLNYTADKIAKGILEREKRLGLLGRVVPGPADSSIYDTENGNCIADDMALIGVRWIKANKSPGSRIQGWQQLRKLLSNSLQSPMEEPGIFIFSNCVHGFIRTVPVLPRDETNTDDVDTDAEDHTGDEVRYRIHKKVLRLATAQTTGTY